MKITETTLPGVYVIEPDVYGDHRGWFTESWSKRRMEEAGFVYDFLQDNHSFSAQKGTLRGIHFQRGAAAQAKLVRCLRGSLLDAAVDLRQDSPSYRHWTMVELSAENHKQLLIPKGFGHAFLTLTDSVEFYYKVDGYYAPEADGSVRWDDPDIGINWPMCQPVLSAKDGAAPLLKEIEPIFTLGEF